MQLKKTLHTFNQDGLEEAQGADMCISGDISRLLNKCYLNTTPNASWWELLFSVIDQ